MSRSSGPSQRPPLTKVPTIVRRFGGADESRPKYRNPLNLLTGSQHSDDWGRSDRAVSRSSGLSQRPPLTKVPTNPQKLWWCRRIPTQVQEPVESIDRALATAMTGAAPIADCPVSRTCWHTETGGRAAILDRIAINRTKFDSILSKRESLNLSLRFRRNDRQCAPASPSSTPSTTDSRFTCPRNLGQVALNQAQARGKQDWGPRKNLR